NRSRYDYAPYSSPLGPGEEDETPHPFLVAMLRSIAPDAPSSLFNTGTLDWGREVAAKLPQSDIFHCPTAERASQWGTLGGIYQGFPSLAVTDDAGWLYRRPKTTMDYSTNGGLLG